jgi:hypothetical protein
VRDGLLRLAPGVPDLAALGARSFADLMGDSGGLEGEARATEVAREPGRRVLRVPLPGTAVGAERLRGRPRGAGTGFVHVTRFESAELAELAELARARLTAPRSGSLAEREWNLICLLRAAGVATPEPLAVGARGRAGLARRSFLVTRELEGLLPVAEWSARHPEETDQVALGEALGLALARALGAGIWLPRLGARDLFAGERGPACAEASPVAGLRLARTPEIAIAGFRGGRLRRSIPRARRGTLLARLAAELGPAAGRALLTAVERHGSGHGGVAHGAS